MINGKQNDIALYATPEHPCSYLPERRATTIIADPSLRYSPQLQTRLTGLGFRRSGSHMYRPLCPSCTACVPVRVLVDQFVPSRSQRRNWQRNQDIGARIIDPGFRSEHFELYTRYQAVRHRGGSMDNADPEQYIEFLTSDWSQSQFVEFHINNRLVALAVIDQLEDALSAVYTFFEPELSHRALGVYAVLWEINQARLQHHPYLYLGYWIANCEKMSYKQIYIPQERLIEGQWVPAG